MRILLLPLLLVFSGFLSAKANAINPVIGDIGFYKKFGHFPTAKTNETLRISIHLQYAEENLRAKDVSHLSKKMQKKRSKILDLLQEYIQQAKFPKNHDYADRKPCFIDKDENICAVGYLVAKTAGIKVAQAINQKHKYDYIYDMQMPELEKWIENSGLTKEECAMIQPTYGGGNQFIANYDPKFATVSTLFSGGSLAFSAINLSQVNSGKDYVTFSSVAGILSGSFSIIYGLNEIHKDKGFFVPKSHFTLSTVNIISGSSSLILGLYQAIRADELKKEKERQKALNFAPFPIYTNNQNTGMGMGFSYTF